MLLDEKKEIERILTIIESSFGKKAIGRGPIRKAIKLVQQGEYYDLRIAPGDPLVMDWYHLIVMLVAFKGDLNERGVFYHTIRKIMKDLESSYFLVSGVNFLLDHLSKLKFEDYHLEAIERMAGEIGVELPPDFIEYLRNFKFTADVMVIPEGSVAFPGEPFVKVNGTFPEALFVESLIISMLTFMTGVATKTSGVVIEAEDSPVLAMELRRSSNALPGSWATLVGGCAATSNVKAGQVFGARITGTMMHAFVTMIGNELLAFYLFWLITKNPMFLIDTFNTIQGAQNAIAVAKIIRRKIKVRLDSGDLVKLVQEICTLDTEDWIEAIALTNDLNRSKIRVIRKALKELGIKKKIIFGVGTSLVSLPSAPSVYKISAVEMDGALRPCIKFSEDPGKENLQGDITLWREYKNIDGKTKAVRDVISLSGEGSPGENFKEVMVLAMKDGKLIIDLLELPQIQKFAKANLEGLPDIYKEGDISVEFPVTFSKGLRKSKNEARIEALNSDEEMRERTLKMIARMEEERRKKQRISMEA